ncbi:hypothetical protein ASPCAL10376 [Aspergillus calidoustus]|uniref:Uncharacterized protein n=1 Tax=Aspergillus calidoustus TaxID=454130 RepID=A0A0U5G8G3_ASPCI|nr:hypothetical protein ASPCAL10376 [Aspergillus calidoustus]
MSNPALYGQKPTKQPTTSTPSSSNLAFTSTLSSLISQNKDSNQSSRTGRPRPSKSSKSDIFARPNKGAQKRAAADLRDDDDNAFQQVHQSSADIGSVDAATLHRSKRRMEEKVRIYEDLKKGAYLAEGSSDSEDGGKGTGDAYLSRLRRKEKEGLVNFDKKWADSQREKEGASDSDTDSSFEHTDNDDNASIVSYEDELGRTRRGTRKEAARVAKLLSQSQGEGGSEAERWRPSRPENLIYGVTVQSEAFQPSDVVASQMAHLAKRRDRSPTPDEVHYDADAEVRNRGTGFYAFSKDEEVRKKQMEEKEVDKLRAKRRAEMFLSGLGDIGVSG